MPLVDLRTDLKSLRYGKDRVGGGSSNQPYIQRDLPDSLSEVGRTGGPDFLLRGGTLVPARVGRDVSRLTQMFFDFKTPNGPLFIAKQNVLALSSTDFRAQSIPPPRDPNQLSLPQEGSTIGNFLRENINLPTDNIYTPLNTLAQVAGGPIGLHVHKQGLNPLLEPLKYGEYLNSSEQKKINSKLYRLYAGTNLGNSILLSKDKTLYTYTGGPGSILGVGKTRISRTTFTDYTEDLPIATYEDLGFMSDVTRYSPNKIIDFRQEEFGSKQRALDYRTSNIESRVNLGDPGKRTGRESEAMDIINSYAMYKKANVNNTGDKNNDLVKFRIAVIDNNNPRKKTFIHFRAFIDQLSDSYNAEWNGERYLGRGEQFYRYNGFTRTINLGWTVAAQSRPELIPQYQKLNYLASSLAPDYSKETGYMRGNLVELSIGAWCFNQPGIIQSMTLDVPQESPWEIGLSINPDENVENRGTDTLRTSNAVKELPHIVKVTNFTFIPIHKFVPRLQQNKYLRAGGFQSEFGEERFIALDNADNNNYDNINYLGENNYVK